MQHASALQIGGTASHAWPHSRPPGSSASRARGPIFPEGAAEGGVNIVSPRPPFLAGHLSQYLGSSGAVQGARVAPRAARRGARRAATIHC
jgi:hypothetical protein